MTDPRKRADDQADEQADARKRREITQQGDADRPATADDKGGSGRSQEMRRADTANGEGRDAD